MRADVTDETEVQTTFDKIKAEHGRIDVLVNVAGGSMHRHPLDEFPLAHWQAVIDANLTSTFLCCRAVTRLMKNQKSGAIVNISSDIAFSGDAEPLRLRGGQSGHPRPHQIAGARACARRRPRQRRRPRTHRNRRECAATTPTPSGKPQRTNSLGHAGAGRRRRSRRLPSERRG